MEETTTLDTPELPRSRTKPRRSRDRIAMISTHGYVAAQPPLGAPDTGGQVVFVIELSKKLAQLGYRVDIWTRRFEGQPETEIVNENVRIIRVPCGGDEFIPKEVLYQKLPQWSENALRYIMRHRLNYRFINSHYWDAGIAGAQLASALDVPHVHTPHSLGIWKEREMRENSEEDHAVLDERFNFARRIHHERILYREAELVIATTPLQADLLVSDYEMPTDRLRMIPPGYDDTRFFPIGEASRHALRQDLGYGKRVIASLGRLARNKGFDLLVEAFSFVAERDPSVELRMAINDVSSDRGDDTLMREVLDLVAKYGLEDRVVIMPSVPDEELADFYRAADVFALSSRYEPFGMTAVEAMACGTPTVMTTHGGLYRAVRFGEHALYADTTDRHEFGVNLLQAIKFRRLRERLQRDGAHRVRSLFTWTGIAQQLLSAVEGRAHESYEVVPLMPGIDFPG